MVSFYTKFQHAVLSFGVALVPFDAIEIELGHTGLCPPGLGSTRYREMSRALFTTLQNDVLPTDARTVNLFSMLENSTRDGYELLWLVFTLSVPVFDPSLMVTFPDWFDEDQCVFQFAQAVLLYFRMQHKRKEVVSPQHRSILFLRNIALDHPIISSLLVQVTSQHHRSGALPEELDITKLARTISTSLEASGRIRHAPRRANHLSQLDDEYDDIIDPLDSEYCTEVMQGSRVNYVGQRSGGAYGAASGKRPVRSDRRDGGRGRGPHNDRRRAPRDGERRRFTPTPRDSKIICDACNLPGHKAAQCRSLGKTLLHMHYIRENKESCKKLTEEWKQFKTPRAHKMVTEYLDKTSLDVATVVDSMDWQMVLEDEADEVQDLLSDMLGSSD